MMFDRKRQNIAKSNCRRKESGRDLLKRIVFFELHMKKQRFQIIKTISAFFLMVLFFLTFYLLLWKLQLFYTFEKITRHKTIFFISMIYCMVMYGFLSFLEGLKVGERRLLDLIFGFFTSAVFVNVIAVCVCSVFKAFYFKKIFLFGIILILFQTLTGFVWIMWCHRLYEKYQFQKEAVFIYGSREDSGEYIRVINTINEYFRISKSICYEIGILQVESQIQYSSVVFLGDIPVDVRNKILKYCMKNKIDCYSIPKISDIYIQNAYVMQLNDKFLLRYPLLEIEKWKRVWKRILDIVVSCLMLICFSPVMLVIAIAIKNEDGGKILYAQERVTMNRQPFLMYKFRSMHENAEQDGIMLARKNDNRITKVGHVIRNLHFDELPQLIHVLRGEMSLVGPRPERQEYIAAYAEKIPEFSDRLKVKAGLTGYAQVYGRYNTEPEDKIKYDLYYIYNHSFWLDLKILILTVRILFQKENTEGVDEGEWRAIPRKRMVNGEKKGRISHSMNGSDDVDNNTRDKKEREN